MDLYIYSYNNYYNRIVKKAGDRIEDYASYQHLPDAVQGVYGFTPGDGVNTTQLIGTNTQMYDGKGDYLIAHDPYADKIDSRWFIIESKRTRNGQWQLTLHRDLVVDYQDVIMNSPMFIEKATITDPNDPAIFNREGLTFNQIKKKETLLKDDTQCPWIVGYIPESLAIANKTITGKYTIGTDDVDFEVTNLQSFDGYAFYTGTKVIKGSPETLYYGYGARILEKFNPEENVTATLPQNGYYFFKNGQYVSKPEAINPGTQTREAWKVFNSWVPSGWQGSNNPGFTAYHKVVGGAYKSWYSFPEPSYFVTGFNSDFNADTFKSKFL